MPPSIGPPARTFGEGHRLGGYSIPILCVPPEKKNLLGSVLDEGRRRTVEEEPFQGAAEAGGRGGKV